MKSWVLALAIFCASFVAAEPLTIPYKTGNSRWVPFARFDQGRVSTASATIEFPNRDFDFSIQMAFNDGAVPYGNGWVSKSFYRVRGNCGTLSLLVLVDVHLDQDGKKIDAADNMLAKDPAAARKHEPGSIMMQTLQHICKQKQQSQI